VERCAPRKAQRGRCTRPQTGRHPVRLARGACSLCARLKRGSSVPQLPPRVVVASRCEGQAMAWYTTCQCLQDLGVRASHPSGHRSVRSSNPVSAAPPPSWEALKATPPPSATTRFSNSEFSRGVSTTAFRTPSLPTRYRPLPQTLSSPETHAEAHTRPRAPRGFSRPCCAWGAGCTPGSSCVGGWRRA
jgi:hypothetical protein